MHDSHHDDQPHRPLAPVAGELITDYRERLARRKAEAAERSAVELAEQTSARNSATDRIRIWERRHGLPLPTRAAHPLLQVVANATGLPLAAVEEEQRLRRQPAPAQPVLAEVVVDAVAVAIEAPLPPGK